MTTATILSIVFNFVAREDHTYKVNWTLNIGGHSEMWAKDGDDHNTSAVFVIMTEYIVGHILKAMTYHHLLLKSSTCGTILGCATIKINNENKVICTQIVMHWATIQICITNWVNMVFSFSAKVSKLKSTTQQIWWSASALMFHWLNGVA